jgi:hypothetical protein
VYCLCDTGDYLRRWLRFKEAPHLPPTSSNYHISRLHLPAPTRLLVNGTSFPIVTCDKWHWSILRCSGAPSRFATWPEIGRTVVGRHASGSCATTLLFLLVPPARPSEMKSRGSKTPSESHSSAQSLSLPSHFSPPQSAGEEPGLVEPRSQSTVSANPMGSSGPPSSQQLVKGSCYCLQLLNQQSPLSPPSLG